MFLSSSGLLLQCDRSTSASSSACGFLLRVLRAAGQHSDRRNALLEQTRPLHRPDAAIALEMIQAPWQIDVRQARWTQVAAGLPKHFLDLEAELSGG